MTKKYVYFVSYIITKKILFKRLFDGRLIFKANSKLDCNDKIENIELYLFDKLSKKYKGVKNVIVINFILLREEEAE